MIIEWQILYFNDRLQKDIMSWSPGLLARYLRLTKLMKQHGPDLGMPHTRAMWQGLFEMRLKAAEGISRVFYCTASHKQIIMLHHFIKKTDKTPIRELETAYRRLKEIDNA